MAAEPPAQKAPTGQRSSGPLLLLQKKPGAAAEGQEERVAGRAQSSSRAQSRAEGARAEGGQQVVAGQGERAAEA